MRSSRSLSVSMGLLTAAMLGACAANTPGRDRDKVSEPLASSESVQLAVQNGSLIRDDIGLGQILAQMDEELLATSLGQDTRAGKGLVSNTKQYTNIWERVRVGYGIADVNSALVKQWEKRYSENPRATQEMFLRSANYIYFFVEELEKRGMPTELALLPFVESSMNPAATSPAQAAGMWQFIPSTGRAFDMNQGWWLDQRRDVIKSTQGALDFLQQTYLSQGRNWHLALAAYNMGEGGVRSAVKSARANGKKGDYLSLSISSETRNYVPKLLALKNIVANPSEFGIRLPPVPNKPYFSVIERVRPLDLNLAAKFSGLSVDEFKKLNPAHKKPVITIKNQQAIVIPTQSVDAFHSAVDAHEKSGRPFVTWQPKTIRPGETLASIAKKAGLSDADLRKVNAIAQSTRILPGSKILAPVPTAALSSMHHGVDEMAVESFSGPRIYEQVDLPAKIHIVEKKETPRSISEKYGISVNLLRSTNGISEKIVGFLKRGASLIIFPAYSQIILTVESGEKKTISVQPTVLSTH